MANFRNNGLPLYEFEIRGYATPCWTWKKSKLTPNGYAKLWHDGRKVYAHRWLYEMHNGTIEAGLELDHLCRNRDCVRPDHLEAVSKFINIHRGAAPKIRNEHLHEIVDLRAYGFSGTEVGKFYGTHKTAVYQAQRRAKGLACH
jgi:hypothetical protein